MSNAGSNNNLDLNRLLAGVVVSLKPPETAEDAAHRRKKDFILFCAALGFVSLLALGCIWLIFLSAAADDQKKWAMGILTALLSGFVGYLVGRTGRAD